MVSNNILMCVDARECSVFLVPDPSAAFDTVENTFLLDKLQKWVGIIWCALNWFASYLSDGVSLWQLRIMSPQLFFWHVVCYYIGPSAANVKCSSKTPPYFLWPTHEHWVAYESDSVQFFFNWEIRLQSNLCLFKNKKLKINRICSSYSLESSSFGHIKCQWI